MNYRRIPENGSLSYSLFHIKGTFSVHSVNGDYPSIPSAHMQLRVPFS